ncbi:MAG: hypothetical protein AAGJ40_12900 [Planctomycetota bacterium]
MSDPTSGEIASVNDTEEAVDDLHADKYNDPRVTVTWQGVIALIAIVAGGAVFAVASAHFRRTRLGKTTEFWGTATIRAIQLGDEVHLMRMNAPAEAEIELTAMPGLGHLRRAFLDERHYDWSTQSEQSVENACRDETDPDDDDLIDPSVRCVQLRFADSRLDRFAPTTLSIDLATGYVGPVDGVGRVKVNERVRPALRHQLTLLMNFQQQRADDR